MSHIATVKVEFKDMDVLRTVCKKLGINLRVDKHDVGLFSGKVKADASFQLDGWRYPVAVCGNELKYDSFNGNWGAQSKLDEVMQGYSVEKTLKQARAMGYSVTQLQKSDGSVQLTLYK